MWDTAEELIWLWSGHQEQTWLNSGAVPAVLSKLFAAKAWEGVGVLTVSREEAQMLAALQQLEEAGLTRRVEDAGGEHQQWQLCDRARTELRSGARLSNPSEQFANPPPIRSPLP